MDLESAQVFDKVGRYITTLLLFSQSEPFHLLDGSQADLNLLLPYRRMIRFKLKAPLPNCLIGDPSKRDGVRYTFATAGSCLYLARKERTKPPQPEVSTSTST